MKSPGHEDWNVLLLSVLNGVDGGFLYSLFLVSASPQRSSFRHIIAGGFVGTYSHVFLDSLLYAEMNPFFPIMGNPFLGLFLIEAVYAFCIIAGFVGFAVYVLRVIFKPGSFDSGDEPFT